LGSPEGTRVPLSFAHKRFDGVVPEPGKPSRSSAKGLDSEDRALLEKVEAGFETVGALYNACKFRAALGEALALACEANGDTCAHSVRAREALTRSVSPGSRSRRIRGPLRGQCTSSCVLWTT
jgi:hypothetical protein